MLRPTFSAQRRISSLADEVFVRIALLTRREILQASEKVVDRHPKSLS